VPGLHRNLPQVTAALPCPAPPRGTVRSTQRVLQASSTCPSSEAAVPCSVAKRGAARRSAARLAPCSPGSVR
jgi:hypothetical protein